MNIQRYYQARSGKQPTFPFTTDGCSGGMSSFWQRVIKPFTKTDIPWLDCCVTHDREYWKGGTWEQRRWADMNLMKGVSAHGYPKMARLMYWGVRVGGSPIWFFSWRWGYGWRQTLIQKLTNWK
jgi:hypothetical protein